MPLTDQQTYNLIAEAMKTNVISSEQFGNYIQARFYQNINQTSQTQNVSDPYNNGAGSNNPGCTYSSSYTWNPNYK